ncbi:MAG: hypothetical protein VX254_06515, partial [Planctomycetota bacterium]|nr:hypothetical protein [Planctomycetota bacterium]
DGSPRTAFEDLSGFLLAAGGEQGRENHAEVERTAGDFPVFLHSGCLRNSDRVLHQDNRSGRPLNSAQGELS